MRLDEDKGSKNTRNGLQGTQSRITDPQCKNIHTYVLLSWVAPDTELAGYRISGTLPSAVYICIIIQGHLSILLKAATRYFLFQLYSKFSVFSSEF